MFEYTIYIVAAIFFLFFLYAVIKFALAFMGKKDAD